MMHIVKYSMRFRDGYGQIPRPSDYLRQIVQRVFQIIVLGLLGATLLAGCGAIQLRAGAKPDTKALQTLQLGKATQQEVVAALGRPDGQGRSMLPWQNSPRTLWSYYYEEGVIDLGGESEDRRIFLFVFLDGDRFDGYMWFSSLKPSP